jgi:hypothetical protein
MHSSQQETRAFRLEMPTSVLRLPSAFPRILLAALRSDSPTLLTAFDAVFQHFRRKHRFLAANGRLSIVPLPDGCPQEELLEGNRHGRARARI